MAKQFEEEKPYLIAGGLLNKYEEVSDKVLVNENLEDFNNPDLHPWLHNVLNDEEEDFAAGQIVGRKEPYTTPDDISATAEEPKEYFFLRTDYLIEAYDPDKHGENFLVLLNNIPQKETGKAASRGEVRVIIDIKDAGHKFAAVPSDGDGTFLESAASGPFSITDQPKNDEGDAETGKQLCAVEIIGLGEEDFYVTGSTDIPAGDYGRTISTDFDTGIMTVDIPDEDDQPNIVVLMNDLTAGGRAIASRRNDIMINYDGEDEPQPGTTIGAQAGSSKPKPGNDGMTVLTAGPEAGRVRAGFFRPRNTWPVAKYLSLVAYYKNFDAETTVQPNTPSIDIVNADTYTHTQEAILYNPVIPKGDYIFHICPILRVHGEWYNYGYSTLRVINYAYADSSSFGLKNPYYQITSTTEFLYDAGDGVEEKIADDIEYSYSSSSSAGFHFPTFNKDYNSLSYTRQSSGGTGLTGIKPEVYYERKQFARAITKTMKGTGRMIARTTFSGSHSLTIWATYSNNQYASRIVVLGGNILGAGKVGVGLDCVMTGDLNAG